jgi:hypothetical protein
MAALAGASGKLTYQQSSTVEYAYVVSLVLPDGSTVHSEAVPWVAAGADGGCVDVGVGALVLTPLAPAAASVVAAAAASALAEAARAQWLPAAEVRVVVTLQRSLASTLTISEWALAPADAAAPGAAPVPASASAMPPAASSSATSNAATAAGAGGKGGKRRVAEASFRLLRSDTRRTRETQQFTFAVGRLPYAALFARHLPAALAAPAATGTVKQAVVALLDPADADASFRVTASAGVGASSSTVVPVLPTVASTYENPEELRSLSIAVPALAAPPADPAASGSGEIDAGGFTAAPIVPATVGRRAGFGGTGRVGASKAAPSSQQQQQHLQQTQQQQQGQSLVSAGAGSQHTQQVQAELATERALRVWRCGFNPALFVPIAARVNAGEAVVEAALRLTLLGSEDADDADEATHALGHRYGQQPTGKNAGKITPASVHDDTVRMRNPWLTGPVATAEDEEASVEVPGMAVIGRLWFNASDPVTFGSFGAK